MTDATPSQRHLNVTCPFCGLGCDDLEISTGANGIHVEANGCPISDRAFALAGEDHRPAIAGRQASLAEAVMRAAAILKQARAPFVGGLGTDVAGMRAALALAERLGATLEHHNGAALQRNAKVLRESGWITTTLSEVRNRADLVLFLGGDVSARFPRFHERLIAPRDPLFAQTPRVPDMIYLGGEAPSGTPAGGNPPLVLPCPPQWLGEAVNALRALVRGLPLQARSVAGIAIETLAGTAARLKNARYSVIVWAAGQLDFAHADLVIDAAAALIKELNQTTRCAGLPLGGRDGDLTVNQVATWQTGYPLPVSFARGFPDFDPYRYASGRILARGGADALLWISAFDSAHKPPPAGVPTVVLARAGATFDTAPDVYIPVATPGIDQAGHIFRCDGVVALPLRALRASELPGVAQVLGAIAQQLETTSPC